VADANWPFAVIAKRGLSELDGAPIGRHRRHPDRRIGDLSGKGHGQPKPSRNCFFNQTGSDWSQGLARWDGWG